MPVATGTLTATKGEAVTYNCTHVTSASDLTPINITGWTIRVTGRDRDGTVILTKTPSVISGAAGTYSFAVTHADTLIPVVLYALDIWRIDSGSEKPMWVGGWQITPEVIYL